MTQSLLKKLCCPVDKHDLNTRIFVKHESGEVREALMTCPECNRYFPVIYGIPVLLPDAYRDKALEAPELKKWGFMLDKQSSKPLLLEEGRK